MYVRIRSASEPYWCVCVCVCVYVCVTHARCVHLFLRASFNLVLVCVCECVCVCAEIKTDGNTQASTWVHFILSVYINTLYEGD